MIIIFIYRHVLVLNDYYICFTVSAGITNCMSVRLVARTQIFFTILKLVGLIIIIIGGIITLTNGIFILLILLVCYTYVTPTPENINLSKISLKYEYVMIFG